MAEFPATLDGIPVRSITLRVPKRGAWRVECELGPETNLSETPMPSGRVDIRFGSLVLSGTIDDGSSGIFADRIVVGVLAGAGAWGQLLPAKGYHNDAGVKGRTVAVDAANAVGETLGSFDGAARLGVDYARQLGRASDALDDAAGDAGWYVDYAGVTHVGARPSGSASEDVRVLEYHPEDGRVELEISDPSSVTIGAVLEDSDRLPAPLTVAELEFRGDSDGLLSCFAKTEATNAGVAGLINALVAKAVSGSLFGTYRYRVVTVAADGRLNLQPVNSRPGLPDLVSIEAWQSAGYHAEPALGAECLVQFVDGQRSQPIAAAFPGVTKPGHKAQSVVVNTDQLDLGGEGGLGVARQNDTVEVYFPPSVPVTGSVAGSPFTGVMTITSPGYGKIQTASAKVRSQ